MNLLQGIAMTIRDRPFFLKKYAGEALSFLYSYFQLKMMKPRNVIVGPNPHIVSISSLNAENSGASISVGANTTIWHKVRINAWGKGIVGIGDHCSIGSGTTIHCRERITFGNRVIVSWNVLIMDFDGHAIKFKERMEEVEYSTTALWPRFPGAASQNLFKPEFYTRPIIIEDGAWIGANAIILKGANVGQGAIIGAGSVVSGKIPAMCVAAGNPARVIKEINS